MPRLRLRRQDGVDEEEAHRCGVAGVDAQEIPLADGALGPLAEAEAPRAEAEAQGPEAEQRAREGRGQRDVDVAEDVAERRQPLVHAPRAEEELGGATAMGERLGGGGAAGRLEVGERRLARAPGAGQRVGQRDAEPVIPCPQRERLAVQARGAVERQRVARAPGGADRIPGGVAEPARAAEVEEEPLRLGRARSLQRQRQPVVVRPARLRVEPRVTVSRMRSW